MSGLEVFRMGQYEYRKDIMDRIENWLERATKDHCKIFVVRLDVRFPVAYEHKGGNDEISEFLRRFGSYYPELDSRYVWARERAGAEHPHYHVLLMLNGSVIQNAWGRLVTDVNNIWAGVLEWSSRIKWSPGGYIELCNGYNGLNGIMIRRPAIQATAEKAQKDYDKYVTAYRAALNWGAYLAKTHTKGSVPPGVREWGSSRY
jgi:hypothetical protein